MGLKPKWPSTEVRDKDQRMGPRSGRYLVHFLESAPEEGEDARTWSKSYSESGWKTYVDSETLVLTVGVEGIREIKRPEAIAQGK